MHFGRQNTFENSSIHFKIPPDFVSGSEALSEESNERGSRNDSRGRRAGSVLEDLMETSAFSNARAGPGPGPADPSLPFFALHRRSGQQMLLDNVKKYSLMRKLGIAGAAPAEAAPLEPQAKKARSEHTWKSSDKSRLGVPGGRDWRLREWPRPPALPRKKAKRRKKHWTVTEFGRAEEPRNLLLDIKRKMRLGSDSKRALLRDDSKIRSTASFGHWEESSAREAPGGPEEGPPETGILGRNAQNCIALGGKIYFCGSPKKKEKRPKSPPKLRRKLALKAKVECRALDLDFLKEEGRLLGKETREQIELVRRFAEQGRARAAFGGQVSGIGSKRKAEKRFMSGFFDSFSKSLSRNSDKSRAQSSAEEAPGSGQGSFGKPLFPAEVELSTALYSGGPPSHFQPNRSLRSKLRRREAPGKSGFLNKSTDLGKQGPSGARPSARLGLFLGVKMSRSKGHRPHEFALERPGGRTRKGNWIKKTTFLQDNIFNENRSPAKAERESRAGKELFSEQSSRSQFSNGNREDPPKSAERAFSVFNQNTITFCAEQLFGDAGNLPGGAEEKPNPFENIELDFGDSEGSDWGGLLGDPTAQISRGPPRGPAQSGDRRPPRKEDRPLKAAFFK